MAGIKPPRKNGVNRFILFRVYLYAAAAGQFNRTDVWQGDRSLPVEFCRPLVSMGKKPNGKSRLESTSKRR